ncbi:type IV secretory system conjugative DNA transfer family protein [Aquincola tertiaricarbonis]|uniref:type IV secretory system conjugative DNA transfer family protein n=1 Tax=Aquincola tertiaricarbonis TaxID=391953 RepID=UPI000614CDD5|nr:type IV secretory system conjugative DNA transfer family protein [Aquincola tertiaricarbonis]
MNALAGLPLTAWPRSRQVTAAVFITLVVGVLVVGALYTAGLLFLVWHRVDPGKAGWFSILDYWQAYGADPQFQRPLLLCTVLPGALVLLLPIGLVLAARPRRALHGAARFATPAEVRRAGLTGERSTAGPSILLGRHHGRFLSLPGPLSVMLSAPTRSGKGVGVVVPNLLNWPDSVVVLDIKGENYDLTAGYRAQHGQAVWAFSPFDEAGRSHRWNPLSAVRTSPLHRVIDLLTIGQVFFPNDGSGTSSEAFFNDQARNLFLGLGSLLLKTPSWPRTLGEMLRQSSGQGQPLKDHLQGLISRRREHPTKELPALSDDCVDALQRLLSNSDNTLSSVVATFHAPLTIFADVVVDAATSGDDFRLQDLRRRRLSVYVRIPPNRLLNARPLLNLFFSQLVSLNTQQLPRQDPTLTVQCLLVNDEFTATGRVPVISTAAAFLAGYGLRLLTVVQAMSQLDAVYGDKEARTFATNHGLQILFAPREQRDADEYSAMLGTFTERATSHGRSRSFSGRSASSVSRNESDQRRALLLPQEFKELGSERLVIVAEHCKPILGDKIRYHHDPVFRARLRPPPAVPAMDLDLHLAKVQRRVRLLPEELPVGKTLSADHLAMDFSALPDRLDGTPDDAARQYLDCFFEAAQAAEGGAIEAEADDDGVLLDEPSLDPLGRTRPVRSTGELPCAS